GFIWGILPPLVALSGLGMLVLAAASGFSERVLFRLAHPRALRGFRLAMARLSLLVLGTLLYTLEARGVAIAPGFARWALLGLALTILAAMAGYRLIAAARLIRRRRAPEPSAATEAAPHPGVP
ncbi:MAG: hypothetical protein LDL22_09230, partial [Hyphomicrobiales bacterium]|nr:hypothetical protein [Hyphomicrobiales bacterium]